MKVRVDAVLSSDRFALLWFLVAVLLAVLAPIVTGLLFAFLIPVLFFFSGLHSDYHKPSDTWDKIDSQSAARLVDVVGKTGLELATASDRPTFVTVVEDKPLAGSGGGYGPYFGSIPDFGQVENGVKFSDVRPGSPAAKAGFKGGDILVQFGDKPIKNLYDFTDALRRSKVGDVVDVTVMRDGQPVKASVKLEQRK